MKPICRHCSKCPVNRPRGLCWCCFHDLDVRALYPSTSKYARRGVSNLTARPPLPPYPTTAFPGSPEKLAVLELRAKMSHALFHPADARYAGDPRPQEFLREIAVATIDVTTTPHAVSTLALAHHPTTTANWSAA